MKGSILSALYSATTKLTLWRLRLRVARLLPSIFDHFLKEVPGVIHVGANDGGEKEEYARHKLSVIWIEPDPDVFEILKKNIQQYTAQKAYRYLVTDKDDSEYEFHVANNNGASSSILDLKHHSALCPDIVYVKSIRLKSITLPTLLKAESISVSDYPALVMDTQGSELLVLQGAVDILDTFRFIKVEVADFESYMGCCQLRDIEPFMKLHGFREVHRRKFAELAGVGSYYDVLYKRCQ